jgi:hypothetical protein
MAEKKSKGLWGIVDGEPFMLNPRLGILNSRRQRKGKKAMARRKSGRAHMAWVRSFKKNKGRKHSPKRRRRSYRRNPYAVAGPVVANPRRRRRGRRHVMRRNPRRRHARRNPSVMGFSLPPLQSVAYVGVGIVGTPLVEGFAGQFLPLSITTSTIGKYAVKIASVIGLTWLAKMVLGGEKAKMVGIGGGAYVLISAVREFAPGVIPGMSAYALPTMGAYALPTTRVQNTLGAPAWGARNTVSSAGRGGANVVAQRFRRFN